MKKKESSILKIKIEKLLTWLAFLVSVSTLYIFFYQTSLMKKQQYASVLPHLSVSNTEIDGDYSFVLTNNGIGPAFIDEINIHYKDSVFYNTDIYDFYSKVIVKKDTILNHKKIIHSTIQEGMLLPEREKKKMIVLPENVENFNKKRKLLREWLNNRISIEIKYSSVYKEQWSVVYPSQNIPIKIK